MANGKNRRLIPVLNSDASEAKLEAGSLAEHLQWQALKMQRSRSKTVEKSRPCVYCWSDVPSNRASSFSAAKTRAIRTAVMTDMGPSSAKRSKTGPTIGSGD
jgi:hypothetical protein